MDILTNRLLRQAVPLFNALAVVLLVIGICAILILGKEVLVHLALAILLGFVLAPVVRLLQSVGMGRGIAVTSSLMGALAIIGLVAYVAYWQISLLAVDLPNYENTIRQKIHNISVQMSTGGVFSRAGKVVGQVLDDVQHIGAQPTPTQVPTIKLDTAKNVWESIYEYTAPVLEPVGTLFVVLLLAGFMLIGREDLRNRFIRLAGTDDIQQTTFALDDAGSRLSRMLLAQLALNSAFGIIISFGLLLIGVPSPFLWGIFAGIMRFVPYVGAIIGLLPPMVAAFAFDPSWTSLLLTVGLFALLEPIIGHVIEPYVYGHSSGLSPLAIVISATLWAFLWGPIGLVLATPISICLVVIGRHVKRLEFLEILMGDKPVLEPHEIFYQRMLAGDPREAEVQALEYLANNSLTSYYDDIVMEAVRRAHLDVIRGTIDSDRLQVLVSSTRELVMSLDKLEPIEQPRRRPPSYGKLRLAGTFLKPAARSPGMEQAGITAILHGTDPLDEVVALIVAQVLEKTGVTTTIVPMTDHLVDAGQVVDRQQVKKVCFSFVEPLSILHLRAYSIAVRRCVPAASVFMCIWQKTEEDLANEMRGKLRVDGLAMNMADTVNLVSQT